MIIIFELLGKQILINKKVFKILNCSKKKMIIKNILFFNYKNNIFLGNPYVKNIEFEVKKTHILKKKIKKLKFKKRKRYIKNISYIKKDFFFKITKIWQKKKLLED
ncbi:hypothetical protein ACT2CR_00560 [Candidatus Vidania fulgoroideorum]